MVAGFLSSLFTLRSNRLRERSALAKVHWKPQNRLRMSRLREFSPDERSKNPYHHIDPGFINYRKCFSTCGSEFVDAFDSRKRPEGDHWAKLFNNSSAINDAGQIVGQNALSPEESHGFVLSAGSYMTLDVPGAPFTTPTGINDAGRIVGWYSSLGGPTHGFLATPTEAVPEPPSVMLFGLGILVLIGYECRRAKQVG